MSESVQEVLDRLDTLNQEIQLQYTQFSEATSEDKLTKSEIEKNIYNGIESFNNAFRKAGSLFKTY